MNTPADTRSVIPPTEGEPFSIGYVGGYFKIAGAATSGRFAVAELPAIPPQVLAAPLHRHHNEDEYTFIVSGTLGVMLGDEVLTAGPGMWIIKPRGGWHTFWNATREDCHIIEIVSPAGFETYFREVAQARDDPQRLAQINQKYAIDMDFGSVPKLCQRFGLNFPKQER